MKEIFKIGTIVGITVGIITYYGGADEAVKGIIGTLTNFMKQIF